MSSYTSISKSSATGRPLASKLLPSIDEWNKKYIAEEYGKPNKTIGVSVWHLTKTLQSILTEESLHPGTLTNLLEEEERFDSVPDITRWGVDVSLGQGTRRGTTANYAVVIGRVYVELLGGSSP
ncbi:hypothetical protein M231_06000 [Tremella mesenterica]|uniref:Uncharacterized protein n=1 Tax=Tremella mesenterica TaxID=5217 RepID=A0A4Q1BGQ6_TREME|nr:hypothetical protein M231_06000 [Tremella mesenterica]